MSRLGDLIHLERTRQGMTFKQVARKCGVSEKFLQEVEDGRRIIADDQARRILKAIGLQQHNESEFTLDDIASTVDLQSAMPRMEKALAQKAKAQAPSKPEEKPVASAGTPGSIWLDALAGVLKHVPVYNAVMKEVDHRLLPVSDGKIAGAPADKVYYMVAPDNALRGFRVLKGDYLLVVPAQTPVDDAIMLIKTPIGLVLRKVKTLPRFEAMLQTFDQGCESEIRPFNEITVVGRCVRLEAEL